MVGARRRALAATVVAIATGAALAAVPLAQAAMTLPRSVSHTYQTNGRVSAIVTVGTTTYLGGSFTSVRPYGAASGSSGTTRSHLAAINNTTGQLLPWNPNANGNVRALAVSGSTVYVGGEFSAVGGRTRHHLAAVSASSGALGGFNPSPNLSVLSLAVTSSRIYLGGTFTTVAGQSRSRLASVTSSGVLDSTWKPAANNTVRAVRTASDGSAVYVGGDFTSVSGSTSQKYLAKLSPTSGSAASWSSHPSYPVYGIATTSSQVFVGGNGAGGHASGYSTGGTRAWQIQTDGGVQAIATSAGNVYIGGHFDALCVGDTTGPTSGFNCPQNKAVRHKLLAVSASSAALDPWAPNPNSTLGVWSLGTTGSKLEVGGDFTALGAPRVYQQGFAQFG